MLAERPPLAPGRRVVTVAPGATAVADFALQVAVQETVRVAARLPGYETDFYLPLGRLAQLHLKLENAFDTVYATSSLFAARAGNFPWQPRTFSALFAIGAFR